MNDPTSPRDMVINLLSRAIQTGKNTDRRGDPFIAGASHAYTRSAAVVAHMAYGTDYDTTKNVFILLVRDVRVEWDADQKADDAKVGQEAEVILNQALSAS